MKNKIILTHLISDHKFINDIYMYDNNLFENQIICLGEKKSVDIDLNLKLWFFQLNNDNFYEILNIINSSDLLIISSLDEYKSQIVIKVSKSVKIFWRFFGIEIYQKIKEDFLSTDTLRLLQKNNSKSFYNKLKILKNKIYNKHDIAFKKAIKRIDYILLCSKEEYDFLDKKWQLPKYLKIPINSQKYPLINNQFKKNGTIIFGNNRHPFNNHIDLINILKNVKNKKIKPLFFFNYGGDVKYSSVISKIIKKNKQVTLIEDFMDYGDFLNIYKSSSALVINSYRQMALGNIFLAINYGLKIYLNEKNIIMLWLKNKGFKIFLIDDLKNDVETNNIFLSANEISHNRHKFEQLKNIYTKVDFQKEIINIFNTTGLQN